MKYSKSRKLRHGRSVKLFFLVLFLFILSGCFGSGIKKEETAKELFMEGLQKFWAENYRMAIESFEKLIDWYPFSKFVIEAELKTSDSYYNLGQIEEAIFAYKEFEKLHPANTEIPYVLYRIGKLYFMQLDEIDRDQTPAYNAIFYLRRLISNYPQSEYTKEAKVITTKCYKSITEHELYVGEFYYKIKNYQAALKRFMKILSDYPDVGTHHKVTKYISLCNSMLQKEKK